MTIRSINTITTALAVFSLFACSKSDDIILNKELFIEASINQTTLDGHIKDDEEIRLEFKFADDFNNFSHLKIIWKYQNKKDSLISLPIRIDVEEFTVKNLTLNKSYSISEEELYKSISLNLDSIVRDSKFKISWTAYDFDNLEIKLADNNELIVDLMCEISEGFMVGKYLLKSVAMQNAIFSPNPYMFNQDTVLIILGKNKFERIVPASLLGFEGTSFKVDLFCGAIGMSTEPMAGAQCDAGIIFYSESRNVIDLQNDNQIVLDFIVDYTDDCGLTTPEQITLTRIQSHL